MAQHTTLLKVLCGLETWFTLSPGEAIVPPPRYKMAIVTWIAMFPLIAAMAFAFSTHNARVRHRPGMVDDRRWRLRALGPATDRDSSGLWRR